MDTGQSEKQTPNVHTEGTEMLDHLQALLETAIEADAPESKDHAIRDALQLMIAVKQQEQNEQAELK